MSEYSRDNMRIARNTLIVYVRMVLIILIGVLCTRFVMQALGVSDYGLYGVVGGLIAILGVLNTAMNTTTRRYINFEMGRPGGDTNRIFNICMVIHIGLALLIFLLAQTIGLFYIYNWLNLDDPSKLPDAVFVFEVSTVSACIGIINLPFQGLLEAHEKFVQTAAVDIVANLLRLGAIVLLLFYKGNALRMYSVIMAGMALFSMLAFHLLCRRQWPETIRWRFFRDWDAYREIIAFNNYTALSAGAYVARTQGSTLLVNFFFGTVVNAGLSVAYQVENFSVTGVNRLGSAAAPQVTQNYSGENRERSLDLVYKISRYSALLMTIVVFCGLVELDAVLQLWLPTVPEGALLFTRWTLISALVRSFAGGTQTLEQATGKIKWFQICNSIMSLLCLPVGFAAFKLGAPPVTIIWIYIGYTVAYRVVEFWLLHRLLDFDVMIFIRKAYLKPLVVVAAMTLWMVLYRLVIPANISIWGSLAGIAATFVAAGLLSFFAGCFPWEREAVTRNLTGLVHRLFGRK